MSIKINSLGVAALAVAALALGACTTPTASEPPTTVQTSKVYERLVDLPPPEQQPTAAVYRYPDRTGKHKPNEKYASYSRAVTQGASSVLVKALNDAGGGSWFEVVPRRNLQDILKERKIVRQVRSKQAEGAGTVQLPALEYAGVVFEGGIVGFDANTMTGGIGAKFLGIGGDTEYRKDTVTVYLRATSTSDGSLLHSVQARKTVFSYAVNASVYKFISYKDLLEAEAGFTNNEPNLVALRKAIEEALYAMIVEGAQQGIWRFDSEQAQERVIHAYEERKARERRKMEQFFAAQQYGDEPDVSGQTNPNPDI
jgi:curli production assembly/transport component CsgG